MSTTAKKGKQQSATSTDKKEGFTAEEKAAMKARARELKAEADGESAVRAAIAAMSPKDRAIASSLTWENCHPKRSAVGRSWRRGWRASRRRSPVCLIGR